MRANYSIQPGFLVIESNLFHSRMSFISGLPDEIVESLIFPKLQVPLCGRWSRIKCDHATVVDILHRLRRLWATSSTWKSKIEETLEWAAWRLGRWEAELYAVQSWAPAVTGVHGKIDIKPKGFIAHEQWKTWGWHTNQFLWFCMVMIGCTLLGLDPTQPLFLGPDSMDPTHPLFFKADEIQNFKDNINCFAQLHCKQYQLLPSRQELPRWNTLSFIELQRLRRAIVLSTGGNPRWQTHKWQHRMGWTYIADNDMICQNLRSLSSRD